MNKTTKVYFILCPFSKEIIYVGVTKGSLENRLKLHMCLSDHNKIKARILRDHFNNGTPARIILINEFSQEKRAYKAEKFYIGLFGRKFFNEGNLLNITKGGAGGLFMNGRKLTDSEKLNLSIKQKEKFANGTLKIPSAKGRKLTQEQVKKIVDRNTGFITKEETKLKLSIANAVEDIYQINSNKEVVCVYRSLRRAALDGNFTYPLVFRCCSKPMKKTHKGFFFIRKRDYDKFFKNN